MAYISREARSKTLHASLREVVRSDYHRMVQLFSSEENFYHLKVPSSLSLRDSSSITLAQLVAFSVEGKAQGFLALQSNLNPPPNFSTFFEPNTDGTGPVAVNIVGVGGKKIL